MRKYEAETGRLTSIDPLWASYYGWSPYQYSMNSPLFLLDDGGMVVRAMDFASRENIINSVETEYRNSVMFKENGDVYLIGNHNLAPLLKDLSNITNITALDYLINSNEIVEVSQSSEFNYVENGEFKNDGTLDWYNDQK